MQSAHTKDGPHRAKQPLRSMSARFVWATDPTPNDPTPQFTWRRQGGAVRDLMRSRCMVCERRPTRYDASLSSFRHTARPRRRPPTQRPTQRPGADPDVCWVRRAREAGRLVRSTTQPDVTSRPRGPPPRRKSRVRGPTLPSTPQEGRNRGNFPRVPPPFNRIMPPPPGAGSSEPTN